MILYANVAVERLDRLLHAFLRPDSLSQQARPPYHLGVGGGSQDRLGETLGREPGTWYGARSDAQTCNPRAPEGLVGEEGYDDGRCSSLQRSARRAGSPVVYRCGNAREEPIVVDRLDLEEVFRQVRVREAAEAGDEDSSLPCPP